MQHTARVADVIISFFNAGKKGIPYSCLLKNTRSQDQQNNMVRILSLNNPRLAQAFVDYMATQGIKLQVKKESQEVQLWLEDESRLPEVEQQVALFLEDPLHARYLAASWHTGSTDANLSYQHYS